MRSLKPIKIIKVAGGYNVFVNDVPVVRDAGNITIDRRRAGLRVSKKFKAPSSTTPVLFPSGGDAAGIAHQIGRYVMNMGDLVFAYTSLLNVPGDHDEWWSKANRGEI